MKIVSSQQMSKIESLAYRDGFSEIDFMEEAGSGVALIVHDFAEINNIDRFVILLCGKGNNAGDAYVAGIHLLHLDFQVVALQINPVDECSHLCKQNYERFINEGGKLIDSLKDHLSSGIIIDGIFGTGFQGKVKDPHAAIIRDVNASRLPIIAIDIPSGLNGETGQVDGEAIIATETAFLGLPKTGFFLKDGWNHVGKLRYVDFGLPKKYIDSFETDFIMLSEETLKPLLPPIKRNRHKYEAGYVVGLSGSPEMPGAALLASSAALKAGAGIVRLLYPKGMESELAFSPYELIKSAYQSHNSQEILTTLNRASAIFIGPGMGHSTEVADLLRCIIPQLQKPCVLDADALNIFSEMPFSLPQHTVMTPHIGEMMRLLQISQHPKLDVDFLHLCRSFATSNRVTLVLKGGPSFIFHPEAPVFVNPSGDPGMATAGAGDVLTGLIAALLAQGLEPKDAASLGVYLHGIAGQHAADDMTSYGMTASDIIYRFPEAFKFIPI